MATPAHCFYCFECLSASFEGREPPSLADIEDLWEQHEQAKELAALQEKTKLISQREKEELDQRIDDDSVHDGDEDDNGGASEDQDERPASSKKNRPGTLKLPNITRLQSQLSSGSSSSSSTPSSTSANSSRSALSNSTTVTSPGSQSSFFAQPEPTFRRPKLDEKAYPLFVTWNTLSRNGHKSLRGCIGTFEAQDLPSGLKSYALTSAFDDTRFSPIPASLLSSLSCSLTLLGNFEPCTNAMDWILGTHGLRISFIHRGRRYGATYLPDVAVEQGWTKEETVESLMRKAGWDGGHGITRRFLRGSSSSSNGSGTGKPWEEVADFRAVKYRGLKASASYAEWQEWRKWVLSLDDGREKLLEPVK
ncbi:hypothetical protein VTN00DRAFT_1644 [Thermoascus crustaceus]|uniref:uncharacterized protein n=1 Tax=Thermoascus crustaceus TaxID=5088 RepID=UPI0037437C5D